MTRAHNGARTMSPEQIAALSARDLLLAGVVTKRLETVPLANVLLEPELTDPRHASTLGRSLVDKGQAVPTAYRAKLEDDVVVYDIIDGFHRSQGAIDEGKDDIESMVHYGLSDEDLVDLRVHAIGSIKSVQFARVATWVQASYRTTDFSEWESPKGEAFSSVHAFELAAYNKLALKKRFDLDDEQHADVIEWVNEKCKRWEKKPIEIARVLKTVQTADPELIKKVREPKPGTPSEERNKILTPGKLQAVSFLMPGEPFYSAQHGILQAVIARNLTAKQAERLTIELVRPVGRNRSLTVGDIYELAMAVPDEKLEDQGLLRTRHLRTGTDNVVWKRTEPKVETPTDSPKSDDSELVTAQATIADLRTQLAERDDQPSDHDTDPEILALSTRLAVAEELLSGYRQRDAEAEGIEEDELTREQLIDRLAAAELDLFRVNRRVSELHQRLLEKDPQYRLEQTRRRR